MKGKIKSISTEKDTVYFAIKRRKKIMKLFVNFLTDLNIEDPMSGFVAVRKKVYENLKLSPIGFKINMEIFYKGKKNGFSVYEVPITFHKREIGKPKSGMAEGFRTLFFIFKLKFNI